MVWTALGLIAVTTGCVATAIALAAHSVVANLLHVERGLLTAGTVALRVGCAIFVLQSVAGIVNTPQVVRLRWRQWTVLTTSVNLLGIARRPGSPCGLRGRHHDGGGREPRDLDPAGCREPAPRRPPPAGAPSPQVRPGCPSEASGLRRRAHGCGPSPVPLTTAQRFFLALNHSTTAVAYLAVAGTLATTLQIIPEQLTAPFLPGLARLQAAGRLHQLRALYSKGFSGLFLLVTPAAVLLAFIARPFLSLWAGPQYGAHSTVPFLVCSRECGSAAWPGCRSPTCCRPGARG